MEKIKIKVKSLVVKKTGEKDGKPWTITAVTTDEGKTYDTFDTFKEGEEVEVEYKANANEKYNGNISRIKTSNGKFPAKDWNKQFKVTALECACEVFSGAGVGQSTHIKQLANELLEWLNK